MTRRISPAVTMAIVGVGPAERARAILADGTYQSELPASEPALAVPLAGGLANVLLWSALIVVIVLAGTWLVNELVRTKRRVDEDALASTEPGDGVEAIAATRHRASCLAAEGQFDVAIHVLLLGAIRHVSAELELSPSPASTSRELLRRLPLSGSRRDAFAQLVGRVELSLFGGHVVEQGDWNTCRDSFDHLVGEQAA